MKSKITLFFAALCLSVVAQAKPAPNSRMAKAELNICAAEVVGCVHTISIAGGTYPVTVDPSAKKAARLVDRMIAIHQLLELPNTGTFLAEGYFAFQGFLPNPMVEQLTFVITNVEGVVLPRALE